MSEFKNMVGYIRREMEKDPDRCKREGWEGPVPENKRTVEGRQFNRWLKETAVRLANEYFDSEEGLDEIDEALGTEIDLDAPDAHEKQERIYQELAAQGPR